MFPNIYGRILTIMTAGVMSAAATLSREGWASLLDSSHAGQCFIFQTHDNQDAADRLHRPAGGGLGAVVVVVVVAAAAAAASLSAHNIFILR